MVRRGKSWCDTVIQDRQVNVWMGKSCLGMEKQGLVWRFRNGHVSQGTVRCGDVRLGQAM